MDKEQPRIINIYRSFNPQNNVSPRDKFKYQIQLIKTAMTSNIVLLGDFKLDYKKICILLNKNMFCDFDDELSIFNLVQMIKFSNLVLLFDVPIILTISQQTSLITITLP